jgi:hypothetical protein
MRLLGAVVILLALFACSRERVDSSAAECGRLAARLTRASVVAQDVAQFQAEARDLDRRLEEVGASNKAKKDELAKRGGPRIIKEEPVALLLHRVRLDAAPAAEALLDLCRDVVGSGAEVGEVDLDKDRATVWALLVDLLPATPAPGPVQAPEGLSVKALGTPAQPAFDPFDTQWESELKERIAEQKAELERLDKDAPGLTALAEALQRKKKTLEDLLRVQQHLWGSTSSDPCADAALILGGSKRLESFILSWQGRDMLTVRGILSGGQTPEVFRHSLAPEFEIADGAWPGSGPSIPGRREWRLRRRGPAPHPLDSK